MLSRVARAMRRRRADATDGFDQVAATVERLATMLAAGVPAATVWAHLDTADEQGSSVPDRPDGILRAAAGAAADGESVGDAIERASRGAPAASAWAGVAAAWDVAAAAGAPLASSLRELARSMRDEAQVRREVHAALSGPRASARMVTALPVLAVGFGLLFGFDTLRVLTTTPVGLACLVLGAGLLWTGAHWSGALGARAVRNGPAPGLELDLHAIALSGGASIDRARELVAAAAGGRDIGSGRGVDEVVELAARAGAPVAELLRAEAARCRLVARADATTRAATLSVRLMVPLGLCVLPAFVLLGVVPLVVSVVTTTLAPT